MLATKKLGFVNSLGRLSGAALDYLYATGRLGIAHKVNAQKVYDLRERLFPECDDTDFFADQARFMQWYVLRRIQSVGLIRARRNDAWLGYFIEDRQLREQAIATLLADQQIATVQIAGLAEQFYIPQQTAFQSLCDRPINYKKVRFIAPLDNFLWDRTAIEKIYNFHYRWEIYTPQAKRQYGYYVLPMLYGEHLVGRIAFNNYRSGEALCVKQLWLEPAFKASARFVEAYNRELRQFAAYLGAARVEGFI